MPDLLIQRPDFSSIQIDSVESTLDDLLADCRNVVATVASLSSPTWLTLMQPLGEVHNALSLFWSPVSHLNSVMNNNELREVYKQCIPKLSSYYTELGQNSMLYNATLSLKNAAFYHELLAEQQRQVEQDLRDFELGGVSLDDAAKKRFGEISLELSKLTTEFSDNVLDATNAWEKTISDKQSLDGLPESAIAAARQRAESKEKAGYLLNLEFPCYMAVMMFANNRALREEVYTAFATRASQEGPDAGKFDNTGNIDQILKLRAEKAALLGFDSFADLSVVPKMVESPQQVLDFLNDLAERAVPMARAEFSELATFAKEHLELNELTAWDIAYASDRLKKQQHDVSDEELKPYFPADKAISGMFAVVGKLFGLKIVPIDGVDVYHPDVRLYGITDEQGRARGEFYMDNFARENKRGGAWMDVCATRQRLGSRVQQPIAYLTCNLTPPVGDDPALLTHMEVTTLFHEFGHGLHHMLTQMETAGVSGINGVEWDAVELPSQFLENWCWEQAVIPLISGHHQTGEPLPQSLLDKMLAAKNFQAGMQMVRQLELGLFDLRLHRDFDPAAPVAIADVIAQVRDQVAVIEVPKNNRFQHGFGHIFAGGYAAGYYSYKWAEVLSADAFSRFEEEGIFNASTGASFLAEILQRGGSQEPMALFVNFRGRQPSVDALLRHSGINSGA
jgi:oligopeptidase A